MKKIVITPQEEGQRLDRFLGKYMEKAPKSFFYKMLRKKNIVLNGKKSTGGERLTAGDEIALFLSEQTIETFRHVQGEKKDISEAVGRMPEITIIYEDEDVLVCNKPVGVLSQKAVKSDVSLVEWLEGYVGKTAGRQNAFKPGICNRLDRNTSGLVVAGKTVRGLQVFNRLFKERRLKKYYLCLVHGRLSEDKKINGYLKKVEQENKVTVLAKPDGHTVKIETAYHPLEHFFWRGRDYTLLRVHLITGKSHQIRAHLQSIGHPIAGDWKYGEKESCKEIKKELDVSYQLLHAWKIVIGDPEYLPEKYRMVEWTAPLPNTFERAIRKMRGKEQF